MKVCALAVMGSMLLASSGCGDSEGPGGGGSSQGGSGEGGNSPAVDCPAPTAGPTVHDADVTSPETWTADASPHVIPGDRLISATLTLQACATVQVAPKATITVREGGSIVANGEVEKPVTIGQQVEGEHWASIRAVGGTLSFTHTTVEGGGDPLNIVPDHQGALDVRGDQYMPPQEILHADHLVVRDSLTQGIFLHEGGGFSTTSTEVTISGSAGFPIHVWANLAGTVPTGDYTGNTNDEILIAGQGQYEAIADWDVTIHNRGVPYKVGHSGSGGTLYVSAMSGVPTLTIEPGVTMRFKKGGALFVSYFSSDQPALGALIAAGMPGAEITFTSAEPSPAPGDWLGIRYGGVPDPTNVLDHVVVDYAGLTPSGSGSASCPYPDGSTNDAAVRLLGSGAPTSVFVTNTTIRNSASHGIDRGYYGDPSLDFAASNTFESVARCTQTYPRPEMGPCPDPVPCP